MSDLIPTVRVVLKESGDEIVINERDFDEALHKQITKKGKGKPAEGATDVTPGPVSTVNVADAKALIEEADLKTLDVLEADEKASVKNPGGRKGVLEAIEVRRADLLEAGK